VYYHSPRHLSFCYPSAYHEHRDASDGERNAVVLLVLVGAGQRGGDLHTCCLEGVDVVEGKCDSERGANDLLPPQDEEEEKKHSYETEEGRRDEKNIEHPFA